MHIGCTQHPGTQRMVGIEFSLGETADLPRRQQLAGAATNLDRQYRPIPVEQAAGHSDK